MNRSNFFSVKWEKIRKNDIIPSHNINYYLNYQCVKYIEPHGPDEYKIKKGIEISAKTKWTASYKECQKLVELCKKRNN